MDEIDRGLIKCRTLFAGALGMVATYPDERFAVYGVDADRIAAMRARFVEWRQAVLEQAAERASDGGEGP